MPHCGIVARLDAQLLLWVYLVGGSDIAGGHGHHKLHVPLGSCRAIQVFDFNYCWLSCSTGLEAVFPSCLLEPFVHIISVQGPRQLFQSSFNACNRGLCSLLTALQVCIHASRKLQKLRLHLLDLEHNRENDFIRMPAMLLCSELMQRIVCLMMLMHYCA